MATPETSVVELLFLQNIMAVRGFVVSLMPDFSRVDDVVQETFLTVKAKAEDFVEGTNFRSWVFSIARLKVLEAARRPGVKEVTFDPEVIDALCVTEIVESPIEEHLRALGGCLEELAPQARPAIELRYQQASRPPEIAKRMGWTLNAVNVALARARVALRLCLERKLNNKMA